MVGPAFVVVVVVVVVLVLHIVTGATVVVAVEVDELFLQGKGCAATQSQRMAVDPENLPHAHTSSLKALLQWVIQLT